MKEIENELGARTTLVRGAPFSVRFFAALHQFQEPLSARFIESGLSVVYMHIVNS